MTNAIVADQHLQPSIDNEVVLSVRGVSKKFCRDLKRSLFYGAQDIAGAMTGFEKKRDKLRPKEFWALQDVSFELRRGESLGLVGKNGCGKSTLLRIIAGLIKPDLGSVEIIGTVAPLIALGAGFNPILTGRENIYANMSILGLSQPEIDERFDEVLDFAEIGDAIDAPVQSYSSGMAARLGFSSAIHTEPDILLIDEVLAVGDVKFRAKCQRKLHELRKKGTSFILVSHQSYAILNVCNLAIYLRNGQLAASGNTHSVIGQYEEDLFMKGMSTIEGPMNLPEVSRAESTGVDILSLFFRNKNGEVVDYPISGEPTTFCVKYKSYEDISNAGLNLSIRELAGEGGTSLHLSSFKDHEEMKILAGVHEIQLNMPYLCLSPGLYSMTVNIRKESLFMFDMVESFRFSVKANQPMSGCRFFQPREWKMLHNN